MLTLPEKILFALLLAGATAVFVHRIRFLVRLIRLGAPDPDERLAGLPGRIVRVCVDVFSQRQVLRKPLVGAFHVLIVWGFFVFAVNTINHFAGAFLPGFHLFGDTMLARYYAAMADVFAVLIILGVLGLAIRRHVFRPPNLTRPSYESALVFCAIGGAMAAYLAAKATAIAAGQTPHPEYHVVAVRMAAVLGGQGGAMQTILAHAAWWSEALLHLLLIGLLVIPTKHLHLAAGPLNLVFARTRPRGALAKMDLEDEDAETFGVARIQEFTWKQNLDLYACIECGRCQDYCPTSNSGKPLKPKELIVDLKDHLLAAGPALLKGQEDLPALPGEVIAHDTIWACTTCGACVELCPMGIEHIDKLTDMRRYLSLMEAACPEEANDGFRNMETAGNPWGLAPADRAAWAGDLDVPRMSDVRETDVLFWVGCAGSYDDRAKKVSVAMARILQAAGVRFAILGEEERCHCESARRLGNEYLYQTAAQEIIETLGQYRFERILATCPHCFNTLANEYLEFGAKYNVVHHTTFIRELIDTGRLSLRRDKKARAVFHDPCYLGRYQKEYDAPRDVLARAGQSSVSIHRERERGFCCGGGGGRMWLEETIGEKIGTVRARELVEAGTESIAVACPFCMTMLTDGVNACGGRDVPVRDIAELVAEVLEP